MPRIKNIAVPPEIHRSYKLYSARHGITITEVARRAIALLEVQNELPHPVDAQSVPVVYQEQQSK